MHQEQHLLHPEQKLHSQMLCLYLTSARKPTGHWSGSYPRDLVRVPELLGVVKVPGRSGSAIFTTGGNSLSTGVGEPIGSSGWMLEQVQADRVVIRQGNDTLQLSLGR